MCFPRLSVTRALRTPSRMVRPEILTGPTDSGQRSSLCRAPSEVYRAAPGGVRPSSVGSSHICSRLSTVASLQPAPAGLILAVAPTGKRRVMQSPPATSPAVTATDRQTAKGSSRQTRCSSSSCVQELLKRGRGRYYCCCCFHHWGWCLVRTTLQTRKLGLRRIKEPA